MAESPLTAPREAPRSPARLQHGDVLGGKYRIEKVLGEGGMGQVLEALHVELDQRVAIKALLPQMATQEEAVARFTREAKGLAKLNSEHVARVFDVGKTSDGIPFMVMEFLEGKDLGELVDARGALPIDEATELALHACAGLAEVHACGIIHRDMKPSNCYVVTRGDGTSCLKLLDFGISKFRGTAVTRTAAIMGSPGYMSPEQMASTKDVDERADIWALGATYYEMLTGNSAFVAANAPMLCLKIANEEPDAPRMHRADLPEALEEVLLKCLAKLPEARYTNVAEVARAIAPFAPARARSYVEKIEVILRGARMTPASDRPPAPNAHDRATVRAGDELGAAKPARGATPGATSVPPPAVAANGAASAADDRETVAPGKRKVVDAGQAPLDIGAAALSAEARALTRAPTPRRTGLFLSLGVLLGAAMTGGVVLVRTRPAASIPAPPAASSTDPAAGALPASAATLPAASTTASDPALPSFAPTSSSDPGAAVAITEADASVADASDDDDDDDDAGSTASAAPTSKPHTAPRRKPKSHPVPKRPPHHK